MTLIVSIFHMRGWVITKDIKDLPKHQIDIYRFNVIV